MSTVIYSPFTIRFKLDIIKGMSDQNRSIIENSDFNGPHGGGGAIDDSESMLNPKESAIKEINRIAIEECTSDEKAIDAITKIIEGINAGTITPEDGLQKAQAIANSVK